MSDNHRRYRAIRRVLTQCYPGELSGRMAQHLTVLAAFISGIVGSKSSQLPSIVAKGGCVQEEPHKPSTCLRESPDLGTINPRVHRSPNNHLK